LDQCLAANNVEEIAGILNGTTNFMLTKMFAEDMEFGEALALAQELGYAERNPAADVEGMDACRKICILASLAFGKHVLPEEVYTEGITEITQEDVRYAACAGGVIKLIGRAVRTEDDRLYCSVSPMILPKDNLLSDVNDVFNAVMVKGDSVGDVVFVGRGAGKLPTASAVVADVIDEVKHLDARKYLFWEPHEAGRVISHRLAPAVKLVRVTAADTAAATASITAAFGEVAFVSVPDAPADELAFVSPAMTEEALDTALAALDGVKVVKTLRIYIG
jgi:homoserine dehydrogenase